MSTQVIWTVVSVAIFVLCILFGVNELQLRGKDMVWYVFLSVVVSISFIPSSVICLAVIILYVLIMLVANLERRLKRCTS